MKPQSRYNVLVAFVIVCLSISSVRAAESPSIAVLRAAGGNVHVIKDGGGTGISFQNCKLDESAWQALESLPDLKEFRISGSGKDFGNEQLARLCDIKTIELIFMNAFGGTDEGMVHLAKLPRLRQFGADHSPFNGKSLTALRNSPNFTSLRFGGCGFDDEGMKSLGELTQLKEANISHVRFTSEGFPHFARLVNLEKLTISPNCFPYYVGADLVHLSGLKKLNTLVIYEMALTYDDGLDHLKGLNLKLLKLHDCRISDADLEKLKAALPNTTIERVFSLDERFNGWDVQLQKLRKPSAK